MEDQNKYINDLEQPEHVEVSDFLPSLKWQEVDISNQWLDFTKEQIKTQYTLEYNGVGFAPIGGIQALTGQAGHGKTAFFTMLMVAILKGEYCGLRYRLYDTPMPKVLYIDTEMEECNTQLVARRLYKIMGWKRNTKQEQFYVMRLREVDEAEMRWKMALKAIYEIKPTVVFLDGFIDVLNDFNDNKECQERIYQDMKAASFYNISFWNILHQNPGSTKMVGHSGSFLERKTTDVFMVQKDKEGNAVSFTAKQLKARGKDVEDMTYKFRDDEDHIGIPYIDGKDDDEEEETVNPIEQARKMVSVIGDDTISFTALRERIRKAHEIGSGKAKEYIDEAEKYGILIRKGNQYTKPRAMEADLNNEKLDDDKPPF